MKRRTSKVLGLSPVGFELKRMEVLRYHNDLHTRDTGGSAGMWILMMLAVMLAPTSLAKPEDNNKKEK